MDKSQKIRYSTNSGSFRFIPTKRTPKTKVSCNIINVFNLLGEKLAERKEVKLFHRSTCELSVRNVEGKPKESR